MDVASKNLDSNDRYSYEGQSEDMHTWFFLYDEKMAVKHDTEPQKQVSMQKTFERKLKFDIFRSTTKIFARVLLSLIQRLSEVSKDDFILKLFNLRTETNFFPPNL